jgi:nifR3 family TIM-barrel protein
MNLWQQAEKPIIALAPMADMTDSPFCRIAKRYGAPIVVREMISAEAVVRGNEKTLGMTDFEAEERPIVQQIFGGDPAVMAEAVRRVEATHDPDGFDVNMGCPVYKIVSNFNGAALMREPEQAAAIVRAMKAATAKPVSVKTRLGWSRPDEILEFIKVLEAAGADLVSVHGRTKEQGYAGNADWRMVGEARKLVALPVLVNGDIRTPEDARRALDESGADGMLIARGALGNPWVFEQIRDALSGREPRAADDSERRRIIMDHARLHLECYGELVTFRKHLVWYFKGRRGVKAMRLRLAGIKTLSDLESTLAEAATEQE